MLNSTYNIPSTILLKGDYVASMMKYDETSFMICCRNTALILDIATMKKIMQISINTEVEGENFSQLYHPLIYTHIIPET